MKIIVAIGFTLNALLIISLFFGQTLPVFDADVAKLVVRERLERNPVLAGEWTLTPTCAEHHGSEGVVFGQAQTQANAKNLDGIAVSETTKFDYRAEISASCSPHNMNCYDVGSMNVSGTQIVAPRL